MADAIYNEIIQLVAKTEDFEGDILEAKAFYTRLINEMSLSKVKMEIDVNEADAIASIDALIERNRIYTQFIKEQNKLLQERQALSTAKQLGYDPDTNSAHNRGQLGMINVEKARDAQAQQELDAEEAAKNLKSKLTMEEANSQASLRTQELIRNKQTETDATHAAAVAKTAQDEADALKAKLKMDEANGQASLRTKELIRQKQAEADTAHAAAVAAANAADMAGLKAKLAAEEKISKIKASVGYKTGSTIAGGSIQSGLDVAGMAAFAVGANSLGGMTFMAERLVSHMKLGNKTLGEMAEKLGLVKLTGDGAEASIAKFGNAVLAFGGVAAGIAAVVGVMAAGNKLDNALASMSTLLADATVTGDKFNTMLSETKNSAIQLSNAFNVDVEEVVAGFKTALSTGIDASELQTFGERAMIVAKGLGTSFEDSTSILTTFKDAYGKNVSDMAHFSDVLFNAINVGKFQVNDLKANIGRVLTSASEAGVGVEDMMAALATLTRVGMSTSQAITSLNSLIVGVVNPTDKAAKMFDKLGLATGSAAFSTKTLIDYLKEVRTATAGDKDVIGDLFGEERARRGAIGLTANLKLADSVRQEMDKVGTATVAANRAMDTFSQNMGKVWNSIWNQVKSAGEAMLTVLNTIMFKADQVITIATSDTKMKELSKETVTNTNDLIKAYDELGEAMKRMGKAGVSAFEGVIAAQKEVYKQLVIDETERGFQDNPSTRLSAAGVPSNLQSGDSELNRINYLLTKIKEYNYLRDNGGSKAARTNIEDELARLGLTPEVTGSQLGGYVREYSQATIDGLLEMQKHLVAHVEAIKKKRNEEAAVNEQIVEENRNLALANALRSKGYEADARAYEEKAANSKKNREFAAMTPAEQASSTSKLNADTEARRHNVGAIEAQFKRLGDLSAELQKYKDISAETTIAEVQNSRRQVDVVKDKIIKLKAILADTENLTAAQRELYTQQLNAHVSEVEIAEKKINKAVADRYKKEYQQAETSYKRKMELYEKEETKLKAIGDKQTELANKLVQSMSDREYARRGPDYARRAYAGQIETGIASASKIADPIKQQEALNRLLELIGKFTSASDAAGQGERGSRQAQAYEAEIAAINEKAKKANAAAQAEIEVFKKQAEAARNVAEKDNPIAKTVRAESQQVIRDTLKEAATHGLTITGDYKTDIAKIDVKVEGMQVSEVTKLIEDRVQQGLRDYVKTLKTGGPSAATNGLTPAGTTSKGIE